MESKRTLLGRRQFVKSAMVSTSALAYTTLAGGRDAAAASESSTGSRNESAPSAARGSAGAEIKYPHLLSPLRVGNVVLKNRILHTASISHYLQGPENFPAEAVRAYYSDVAKNAAMVTIRTHFDERGTEGGMAHFQRWEDTPLVHNYLEQLIEGIHCEGALVAGGQVESGTTEEVVAQARKFEDMGYDAVWVGTRMLKDREELKPVIDQMQAVKNATNLLIVGFLMPKTPGVSRGIYGRGSEVAGPVTEEAVAMAKMMEGVADILQMRDAGRYTNHPNTFNMTRGKPETLRYAEAIKKAGVKIATAPNGGFRDPSFNEACIASGKTDMVAMARPFISDPEYIKKAHEGRGEDWTPCIMCNKCHGLSQSGGPYLTVCSVNPKFGLSVSAKRIHPPSAQKRVAVIGGGPAGMKAALVAVERGHRVTLFEKSDTLGGLLRHSDYSPLRWAYKDFKDYLIRQVHKVGVSVQLNTDVTPEMIRDHGYDTALIAVGAAPVIPNIPGVDAGNVYNIVDAYKKSDDLGKNVVIIGGGDIGTEAGICLAAAGHQVTGITSAKQMMEIGGPHGKDKQIDMYQNMENYRYIVQATVSRIAKGKVFYVDALKNEKFVQADSVVIYAGFRPRMDEAMTFSQSAAQVLLLGDCTGRAGDIQKTIRSAFFAASQV